MADGGEFGCTALELGLGGGGVLGVCENRHRGVRVPFIGELGRCRGRSELEALPALIAAVGAGHARGRGEREACGLGRVGAERVRGAG